MGDDIKKGIDPPKRANPPVLATLRFETPPGSAREVGENGTSVTPSTILPWEFRGNSEKLRKSDQVLCKTYNLRLNFSETEAFIEPGVPRIEVSPQSNWHSTQTNKFLRFQVGHIESGIFRTQFGQTGLPAAKNKKGLGRICRFSEKYDRNYERGLSTATILSKTSFFLTELIHLNSSSICQKPSRSVNLIYIYIYR